MKCQCVRSPDSKAKDAFCFCSGVKLARNLVAADVIAPDVIAADRSTASNAPAAEAQAKAMVIHSRADFQAAGERPPALTAGEQPPAWTAGEGAPSWSAGEGPPGWSAGKESSAWRSSRIVPSVIRGILAWQSTNDQIMEAVRSPCLVIGSCAAAVAVNAVLPQGVYSAWLDPRDASPSLEEVLARAGAYVAEFEKQLSGIVSEEQYIQQVTEDGRAPVSSQGGHANAATNRSSTAIRKTQRRLRSDLLLVKPFGAENWMQFRDVYEVDGVAVRDRDERLTKLFLDPVASVQTQVARILSESARFNIGPVLRTVNAPTLPLLFLEPKHQHRFKFKRTGDDRPDQMTTESPVPPGHFHVSTEVWVVEYRERKTDTMIRTTELRDLPARGRFWIEPATGRVLMTELILENRAIRGTINVNYQSEPLVGLLVPIEMRERYDRLRDRSVIDGFATYGRFRQFQVKVDEKLGPIKRQE